MMYRVLWGLFLTGVMLVLTPPALAGSFSYSDFSSLAGLSLVGSAAQVGPVVRLTDLYQGQVGGLWYGTPVTVSLGFISTFTFRIDGPQPPADGLAFVIQTAGPGTLGGAGGYIGYHGLPNTLAVEFDTWNNGWEPPGQNPASHVAVHSCGTAPNSVSYAACGLGAGTPATPLASGTPFVVTVMYTPGTLTVTTAGMAPIIVPVNLASLLNLLPGGQAYIGFTAGTGAYFSTHDLLQWSTQSTDIPEPSTSALLATGLLALGVLWRKRR